MGAQPAAGTGLQLSRVLTGKLNVVSIPSWPYLPHLRSVSLARLMCISSLHLLSESFKMLIQPSRGYEKRLMTTTSVILVNGPTMSVSPRRINRLRLNAHGCQLLHMVIMASIAACEYLSSEDQKLPHASCSPGDGLGPMKAVLMSRPSSGTCTGSLCKLRNRSRAAGS